MVTVSGTFAKKQIIRPGLDLDFNQQWTWSKHFATNRSSYTV